mmetsp:Transcript_49241/g.159153  ORF Transcript_49241/g.159153 Transcript_49241/m.159153 type:complete len:202 (+) Transcript_49241:595-1200(+)
MQPELARLCDVAVREEPERRRVLVRHERVQQRRSEHGQRMRHALGEHREHPASLRRLLELDDQSLFPSSRHRGRAWPRRGRRLGPPCRGPTALGGEVGTHAVSQRLVQLKSLPLPVERGREHCGRGVGRDEAEASNLSRRANLGARGAMRCTRRWRVLAAARPRRGRCLLRDSAGRLAVQALSRVAHLLFFADIEQARPSR